MNKEVFNPSARAAHATDLSAKKNGTGNSQIHADGPDCLATTRPADNQKPMLLKEQFSLRRGSLPACAPTRFPMHSLSVQKD